MKKKGNKKDKRERPSWDESFMFSALWTATRSSCLKLQNGAVIAKNKRVLASGYNGAPPGIKNCLQVGCRKEQYGIDFHDKGRSACRGTHAEENAMRQIAMQNLEGATLYTVFLPCTGCAKDIVGSEIRRVVYCEQYHEPESLTKELFEERGVKLVRLNLDVNKCYAMMNRIYSRKTKK